MCVVSILAPLPLFTHSPMALVQSLSSLCLLTQSLWFKSNLIKVQQYLNVQTIKFAISLKMVFILSMLLKKQSGVWLKSFPPEVPLTHGSMGLWPEAWCWFAQLHVLPMCLYRKCLLSSNEEEEEYVLLNWEFKSNSNLSTCVANNECHCQAREN